MYGLVIVVAITAGDGAPAHHHYIPYKAYPASAGGCYYGACYGVGYTGFQGFGEECLHPGNPGGWGKPYGGYGPVHGIAGYDCYGGCGGYHSPAYGVPIPAVVAPNPYPPTPGQAPMPAEENKIDRPAPKKSMDPDDDGSVSLLRRAKVIIDVPAGARLFVDGQAIANPERGTFRTPELQIGKRYYYELRVETMVDGKPVSETKRITVRAGDTVRADFTRINSGAEVASSQK